MKYSNKYPNPAATGWPSDKRIQVEQELWTILPGNDEVEREVWTILHGNNEHPCDGPDCENETNFYETDDLTGARVGLWVCSTECRRRIKHTCALPISGPSA
jgi:hypothetical protein